MMEISLPGSPGAQGDAPFLEFFIAFFVVIKVFHTWLDLRQLSAIKLPAPPKELSKAFTSSLYLKTQAYSIDKWWLSFWHSAYSFLETLAALRFHALPWLWRFSGSVATALLGPASGGGEIVHTISFVLVLLFIQQLMELPCE